MFGTLVAVVDAMSLEYYADAKAFSSLVDGLCEPSGESFLGMGRVLRRAVEHSSRQPMFTRYDPVCCNLCFCHRFVSIKVMRFHINGLHGICT